MQVLQYKLVWHARVFLMLFGISLLVVEKEDIHKRCAGDGAVLFAESLFLRILWLSIQMFSWRVGWCWAKGNRAVIQGHSEIYGTHLRLHRRGRWYSARGRIHLAGHWGLFLWGSLLLGYTLLGESQSMPIELVSTFWNMPFVRPTLLRIWIFERCSRWMISISAKA